VDEDSVEFKKHDRTEQYDQGTVTFRARKGKLIDLDKLHESVRATRLSGGTRSGLVSLDVTAVGHIASSGGKTMLTVAGSDARFSLEKHPDTKFADAFSELRDGSAVKLTGRVADYAGRWPKLLGTKPKTPRRLLVTNVEELRSL
jgi:hypothetical protein